MSALNDKNRLNNPQIGIYHPQLLAFVIDRLKHGILGASDEMHPVMVGTASEMVQGMNRNRRGTQASDSELTITRIDMKDGNPLAILINWTAHPTLMDEEDMWVSGGWPGFLQRELEAWIGRNVIAMYYNGASGDQSPVATDGGSHYEQAENYGRKLARKAFDVYGTIEVKSNPAFDYNFEIIDLPSRSAHPAFLTTGGEEYGIDDDTMNMILESMCPDTTAIGVVRIGDLLIAGTPGELSSELGLRVKRELHKKGVKHPVIGGLANEWISYILSEADYSAGGYEASLSFYGPTLGEVLVRGMLRTVSSMIN
jgi:hypothetical protein